MQSPPRNRSTTSLRQRRSMSPQPSHKHVSSEETEPFIGRMKKGRDATTTSTGKDKTAAAPSPPASAFQLAWSIVVGAAMLILVVLLALLLFWLALLSGLYNPDTDCAVPTFDYPDCSNAHMHVGEVAPPLTSQEWLHLREQYHQAMVDAGQESAFSLAQDWRDPNTYGFVDMSAVQVKFSPGRGRALFATQPIPKGTKIWDSRYRAVFPNSCVAKIFFANQTNQQKCDAMFWGYINNFYGNGIQFMYDLDGHGYINHGGPESNAKHHFDGELDADSYVLSRLRIPALGIFPLVTEEWERRNTPGAYGLYAARDIQENEEIVYNYDEIFMYGWLDWHTLMIERSLPIWEWFTL